MNVLTLTDYLVVNPEAVLDLLDWLEFTNISHNKAKNEVRFSREDGSNPTSVCLNLNTLYYVCFSTNERGNIFSLVMKKKNLSFPQSLEHIAMKLGLSKQQFNKNIRLPFGSFYKKIIRQSQEPEYEMTTYDESILEPYLHKYNMMFFDDGIDFDTQEEFKVGFDIESLRITIPIWTLDGRLCGIMGRLNDKECKKEERWLPIIPCSRSLTLYGYHKNYLNIQEKGLAVIAESEKSVMKLFQMGCKNAVAVGGCNISEVQSKYIKGLMVDKYIVCFDEGLSESVTIEQCKKLIVKNSIMQNKVGYIFDEKNNYLPKNSKLSPCDMPKDIFIRLMKESARWINI